MNNQSNIETAFQQASEAVALLLLEKAKELIAGGTSLNGLRKKEAPSILSPKEKEIWDLFRDELNVKQIANRLKISEKTVEVHRDHIRIKLNLKSAKEFYELVKKP